ncbi:hypothetical protein HDU97_009549 [Phlyctochytrium planicorne]|nr:hypothetical protein HDU97_009549 [Phlyctochytrium planicorne]
MLAWLYSQRSRQIPPPSDSRDEGIARPPSPDVDWLLVNGDDGLNGTVEVASDGGTMTPRTIIVDAEMDPVPDGISDVYTVESDDQPKLENIGGHPSPPASPQPESQQPFKSPRKIPASNSPFAAPSRQYVSRKTRRRILRQLASESVQPKQGDPMNTEDNSAEADHGTAELDEESCNSQDDVTSPKSPQLSVATTTIGNKEIPTLLLLQHAAAKARSNSASSTNLSASTSSSLHPVLDRMKKTEANVLKMRQENTPGADWKVNKRVAMHVMKSQRHA